VWNLTIGDGKRPVDTATAERRALIDGWERNALVKAAKKDPQGFLKTLNEDSRNGTKVTYEHVQKVGRTGVVRGNVTVADGVVDAVVRFEVYNKKVDKWLGDWTTEGASGAAVVARLAGQLTSEGGLDHAQVSIALENLPAFSVDKIMELGPALRQSIAAALAVTSKKGRKEALTNVVDRLARRLEDAPLPFVVETIGGRKEFTVSIAETGEAGTVNATFGNGAFDVTVDNLLGRQGEQEASIQGHISGTASKQDRTFKVDDVRLGNLTTPFRMAWAGGRPVFQQDGRELNDHMMELPMILGFLMMGASQYGVL
jgi:hypothetical protein